MQLEIAEAARILNVSERTVNKWIADDELPVHKVDDRFYINPTELLEWATLRRIPASPELFQRQSQGAGESPSLARAFSIGTVFTELPGNDRESVLRAVVDRLPARTAGERQTLLHLFLARELAGGTAVGGGVALPHPRRPIVLGIAEPAVYTFYLAQPVDFQAPDRQPVHCLFTIIAPTVSAHLRLLAGLATALQDKAFQELVSRRAPQADLLSRARELEGNASKTGPSLH